MNKQEILIVCLFVYISLQLYACYQGDKVRVTTPLQLLQCVGENWEHLEGLSTTSGNSSFWQFSTGSVAWPSALCPGQGRNLLEGYVFSQDQAR